MTRKKGTQGILHFVCQVCPKSIRASPERSRLNPRTAARGSGGTWNSTLDPACWMDRDQEQLEDRHVDPGERLNSSLD